MTRIHSLLWSTFFAVAGPTSVDSVATFGLFNINVLKNGTFAIAVGDGTNLVAAVYSQSGVLQGSAFSTAYTVNPSNYNTVSIKNDQVKFWISYVSATGTISVAQLTAAGVVSNEVQITIL